MDINQLNDEDTDLYFKAKYIKYKLKYLALKQQKGGLGIFGWNPIAQPKPDDFDLFYTPAALITGAVGQITPQELTLKQKIQKEIKDLQKEIKDLQQELEEINKKNPKDIQDKNKISIIEMTIIKKNKALKAIIDNEKAVEQRERMAIAQHQNEQEADKRYKEQIQIHQNGLNNAIIVPALTQIIRNNKDNFLKKQYFTLADPKKEDDLSTHVKSYNFFPFIDKKYDNLCINNFEKLDNLIENIINFLNTKNHIIIKKNRKSFSDDLKELIKAYITANKKILYNNCYVAIR